MSSPTEVLHSGATQTFEWDDQGYSVTEWQISASHADTQVQYYDSGSLAAGIRSHVVTGLPTDGSSVAVKLSAKIDGSWRNVIYVRGGLTDMTTEIDLLHQIEGHLSL